jgi:hypothetical protein
MEARALLMLEVLTSISNSSHRKIGISFKYNTNQAFREDIPEVLLTSAA